MARRKDLDVVHERDGEIIAQHRRTFHGAEVRCPYCDEEPEHKAEKKEHKERDSSDWEIWF